MDIYWGYNEINMDLMDASNMYFMSNNYNYYYYNTVAFELKLMKFDEFMWDVELIDLSIRGRRFTWSKVDGSSMSQIDKKIIIIES